MMKKVKGRVIEFDVMSNGSIETRKAIVKQAAFTKIGVVYTAVTPFGHEVKLTKREIKRFL